MEISKKERKNKQKIRDVPIATIRMNKPVYAVPLQSTMSFNFILSRQQPDDSDEATTLTIPLHSEQSSYHGLPNPANKQTSFESGNPGVDAREWNPDPANGQMSSVDEAVSKKIEVLDVNETTNQLIYDKYSVETKGLDMNQRLEGQKGGKRYVVGLNDQKDGYEKTEEVDSDGELDVDKLAARSKNHRSTFNHMTWRLPSPKKVSILASSIIIYCDSEIVVMIKMTCTKEGTLRSTQLHAVMVDVAENSARRLKQMRNLSLPKLCARHMDGLPLNDQRTTKTHLLSISQELADDINLSDVAYRYQTEDIYIGTFVSNKVRSTRQCCIGDTGVVVILSRRSKYATFDSFSEQLCQHIAATKPTSLGYVSEADVRKINKRGTVKIMHLQRDQLMLQNFLFDSTIIVAEAARRCFVKIEDFMLFH